MHTARAMREDAPAIDLPHTVFFGSGAFGLPVLRALHAAGALALVVSQPDRRAGRGGALTPTPVSAWALEHGAPLMRPDDCNAAAACDAIRAAATDAARATGQPGPCYTVIAYGQKMGPALLHGTFAINLHGSLLPRWRGAAPYQRAIMEGDCIAGVTVIAVAERMDAGAMFAKATCDIGSEMTAVELHDALSALGPGAMLPVLREWRATQGALVGEPQDDAQATRARKLSRADGWVDLHLPARAVRARINGLSDWPGCSMTVGGHALKVLRAREVPTQHGGAVPAQGAREAPEPPNKATGSPAPTAGVARVSAPAPAPAPGVIRTDLTVACGEGAVVLLSVQPPGGKVMPFAAWCAGRRVGPGALVESAPPSDTEQARHG